MSIAYKILKKLISDRVRTKEDILKMADVYYAAGRITEDEYTDIVSDAQTYQPNDSEETS